MLEVANLKDHPHVREERDAFVGCKGEHPIVIHDRVHRFNPIGVQVAVQNDPLWIFIRCAGQCPHDVGEQSVSPFSRRHADVAIKLLGLDRLGVEIHHGGGQFRIAKIPSLLEGAPALRFTGTRRTHDKDTMADGKELFQLHHLQSEGLIGIVAQTVAGLRYVGFQGHILLPRRIDSGEQIVEQAKEDHFVLLYNFGRIEISKRPH
mmetsp:Transcript_29593/g.86201  ORF Transcript_29593/g.86201 Transcript_29593/m.86201 type:complete len:206 (-) Transcript_29593:1588-2205(-)